MKAVVIGDLLVDIVIGPAPPLRRGDDVTGPVTFRQGGSAATTARWLARLGLDTTLITCVGRDVCGRALVAFMERRGVRVDAARPIGVSTGRMAVLLDARGERSFVGDRRAATALPVSAIRPRAFSGAKVMHVPAYSLFGQPLADATLAAGRLAHSAGALVSVDLASASFIAGAQLTALRNQIEQLRPDIIFSTPREAAAFVGSRRPHELTAVVPLVVLKRGAAGATVLARDAPLDGLDVPTTPLTVSDVTGAGDAFAAGVLAALVRQETPLSSVGESQVSRAVRAGHRAARRELSEARPDLFG